MLCIWASHHIESFAEAVLRTQLRTEKPCMCNKTIGVSYHTDTHISNPCTMVRTNGANGANDVATRERLMRISPFPHFSPHPAIIAHTPPALLFLMIDIHPHTTLPLPPSKTVCSYPILTIPITETPSDNHDLSFLDSQPLK